MSQILRIAGSGLRAATATFRRRLLLALVLTLVVAIPSYALILSNVTQHVITVQDVTITASPPANYTIASGNSESGTVTVNTPQTFTGVLTLSITNTTTGALYTGIDPNSFTVTIDGFGITGLAPPCVTAPCVTSILYVSHSTTITNGYVFHYTVTFLGKSVDKINGIATGSTYQISQTVSQ